MQQQVITLVGVAYVGSKAVKRDTTFGTRLTFTPGQVHHIEAFTANRMLQHKDVYAPEDSLSHRAILAKLEQDQPVVAASGPVQQTQTPEQILAEQLEALTAALKKIARKDGLPEFEVVKKLGLELDLELTRAELDQQIHDAFKAYIAGELGIKLEPVQGAE